ncbi:MAG: putative proteasome-type protease [Patiriisocius sp.]|jgi:putative proteasome-type protease
MTYCLAIAIDDGLCFISDSRTNAGVDNVSTYSKMHMFGEDHKRQIILLSAGNLATTQGVIARLKKDIRQEKSVNLLTVADMEEAADYVGEVSHAEQDKHRSESGKAFEASFIVGGQILKRTPKAYLVYPQGNHITTSSGTPYLQIGESKYGKPILDRLITLDASLETSVLCGLVSMDSTMRSNLTVGPPIEVLIYHKDSLEITRLYRFEENSEYLRQIRESWDQRLKEAFANMPPIAWSANWDNDSKVVRNTSKGAGDKKD